MIKSISILALAGALSTAIPAQAQIFGGHNGRSLVGAGIGAGLGGVLGSNLAGTGVQQEGTAIGAVVGGLLGAGIANHTGSGRYGSGYRQPSYGYNGGGISGQPYIPAGDGFYNSMSGGQFAAPMPAPQYIQGGYVDAGSYTTAQYSNSVYQPAPLPTPAPRYVYQPAPAPKVITQRVVHEQPVTRKTIYVQQPQQVIRKTIHVIQPKPVDVVEYRQAEPLPVQEQNEYVYAPMPAPAPVQQVQPVQQAPMPVQRPTTYCYAGSSKRYNKYGKLMKRQSCK